MPGFKLESSEMLPPDSQKPMKAEDREQAQAERNAIKADYKQWSGTLSHKDFVKFAQSCYNTYMESAQALVDKDTRLAMLDQATGIKKMLDYIDRQAK